MTTAGIQDQPCITLSPEHGAAVGAVGVSGGGAERDHEIAKAGANEVRGSQTSEPLGTGHVQAFALADRKALM